MSRPEQRSLHSSTLAISQARPHWSQALYDLSRKAFSAFGSSGEVGTEHTEKASDRMVESGERGEQVIAGSVIGVMAAKGGSGSSTLALNLSVALSSDRSLVTLVDANLQQPQIAAMLHRSPKFTWFDVVSRAPNVDLHLLEACAERITASCLILSPPANLQVSLTGNLGELAEAVPVLKSLVSQLVIDLPRHLDKHLVRIIDQCDQILLVFEPTLVGVAAARHQLNIFRDLECDERKVILVANRCGRNSRQVERELGGCFGGYRLAKLPNDFDLCQQSFISGKPAILEKARSAYSRAVSTLAGVLTGAAK